MRPLEVAAGELAHAGLVRKADDSTLCARLEHRLHVLRRGAGDDAQVGVPLLYLPHMGGIGAPRGMPCIVRGFKMRFGA